MVTGGPFKGPPCKPPPLGVVIDCSGKHGLWACRLSLGTACIDPAYWIDALEPEAIEVHAHHLTEPLIKAFHASNVIVQAQTVNDHPQRGWLARGTLEGSASYHIWI